MATQEAADRCAHLIQLWLDNEQSSHEYVCEIAAGYGDAYSVGRAIKDYVEELCGLDDMPAGIASDLLGFCLAVVDWQAMGERYMASAREAWEFEAHELGRSAGMAAASWVVDGNTKQEHVRRVIEMLDAGGDIGDYLPARPNLSGEWAGDPTPQSIAREVTELEDVSDDIVDAIAEAWEAGVDETFESGCERILRSSLEG